MSGVSALYLVLLAAVAGYVLIARVPSVLHTPMLSGSNFIHGIVLAGAMLALANAQGLIEQCLGFLAVMAASANAVGGFVVTDRMLALFDDRTRRRVQGKSALLAGRDNPVSEDRRVASTLTRRLKRSVITSTGLNALRRSDVTSNKAGSGDTGSGDTGSGSTGSGDAGLGSAGSGDAGSGSAGSAGSGSGVSGESSPGRGSRPGGQS